MAYRLLYHPDITKCDLVKMPKNVKESIRKAIEERLLTNPVLYGQPLRQSLRGHRKLRVGAYRVIYRIHGDEIIILKIGHRKEIYSKIFSRIG